MGPEKGIVTSEFILNIVVVVLTFTLLLLDKLDPEVWAGVTGVQAAAYTLGRSYRKGQAS